MLSPFLKSVSRWWMVSLGVAAGILSLIWWSDSPVHDGWLLTIWGTVLLCSVFGVLIGGARAILRQNAERRKPPDSLLRADRLDLALGLWLLGALAGCLAGFAASEGGECLAPLGAVLGLWVLADSPLSPVFILANLGWATLGGLVAGILHPDLPLPVLRLVPATLLLILAFAFLKRFLAVRGPAGWLYTLLAFTYCLWGPFAMGVLAPPHELPDRRHDPQGPVETFMVCNLVLIALLSYHWCLRARARPGEPTPEPTQGGCGCAYFGLGMIYVALDRAGSSLQGTSPGAKVAALAAGLLLTLLLAYAAQRRIHEAALGRGRIGDAG